MDILEERIRIQYENQEKLTKTRMSENACQNLITVGPEGNTRYWHVPGTLPDLLILQSGTASAFLVKDVVSAILACSYVATL